MTDFTDLSGAATTYNEYVMESGDRIFTRGNLVARSAGGGSSKNIGSSTITGGTGKFVGIRGVLRSESTANPKAGTNETKAELEYWLPK